jgi:hypothetical protein
MGMRLPRNPRSDPGVSPQEKWAIYSIHLRSHKIIGNLGQELQAHLSFSSTNSFIQSKQGLSELAIDKVNIIALGKYMQDIKIHRRATTAKLIHGWIQTYCSLCHQGRESSPFCPQFKTSIETRDHVLTCGDPLDMEQRSKILSQALQQLMKISTPIHIIIVLE